VVPIIWAPLSETYGRKMPILVSIFGLPVFSLTATAKYLQTVLLVRFFGGFVRAHLAVVAASIAYLFNTTDNEVLY
jgi:DHA1 family multidrug resistance protein-like MFS transporter